MKTPVDIWAELGARLSSFGQDAASREVIARACQKNDWFEPEEIVDAVRSIREEFLSRDKIERWLACYERPATLLSRTVLVVMAGNIPLVGFFDLLCVVTAGHRCLVKMSSKDAMLMSFVIDQLKKIEPGDTGFSSLDAGTLTSVTGHGRLSPPSSLSQPQNNTAAMTKNKNFLIIQY